MTMQAIVCHFRSGRTQDCEVAAARSDMRVVTAIKRTAWVAKFTLSYYANLVCPLCHFRGSFLLFRFSIIVFHFVELWFFQKNLFF